MDQPTFNTTGKASADEIQQAVNAGLPLIDSLQVVGMAQAGAVTWYRLEDGSDRILDDKGQPATW